MLMHLAISFFVVLCGTAGSEDFSYKDPNKEWGEKYPACNGNNQSPINVMLDVDGFWIEDETFQFNNYKKVPDSMPIVNNGHTVQIIPVWSKEADRPYLSGGPFNGEYVMERLEFHWGKGNTRGSEHKFDHWGRALEVQMVHWKRDYGSFEEAVKNADGVAVVAIIYGALHNVKPFPAMIRIGKYLEAVRQPNSESQIKPFRISAFPELTDKMIFVTYDGSLTSPGCNEGVKWLLRESILDIGIPLMEKFWAIELAHGDDRNNRPIQKLGNRKLKYYKAQ